MYAGQQQVLYVNFETTELLGGFDGILYTSSKQDNGQYENVSEPSELYTNFKWNQWIARTTRWKYLHI